MPSELKAFVNEDITDYNIHILGCGHRICKPDFVSMCIRHRNHILFYVHSGECAADIDGVSYIVHARETLFVRAGVTCRLSAVSSFDCEYRWIEFNGENIDGFIASSRLGGGSPVIRDDSDGGMGKIFRGITDDAANPRRLNGHMWFLADKLTAEGVGKKSVYEKYIRRAVAYVRSSGAKKTTVADVAEYLDIDRSYLSRIFNEHMGVSIKSYIYDYHMEIAKNLLMYSSLPIKNVAQAVGYDDPLDFTKAFHRSFGCSPSTWRKENSLLQSGEED